MENSHYFWGDGCEAWKITDTPELSVIKEKMPPGTSEKLHYHEKAKQVFYILKGEAEFIVDHVKKIARENEYLVIEPGQKHFIQNKTEENLEFIVVSSPRSHGDRIEI